MEFKEYSKIDKFNLGLGLSNLIFTILIAIWGISMNERIAEKSGAFDKGEIKLSFGGYLINPSYRYDVYYGIDFSDSTLHLTTLPLGIHNNGKKTLEDVKLLMKYPHNSKMIVENNLLDTVNISISPIVRKILKVNPYDQTLFECKSINPNLSILTEDMIYIHKEIIERYAYPAKTKDEISVNATIEYKFSPLIQLTITAKDIIAEEYFLNMYSRQGTDINKLIKEVINEKLNEKHRKGKINDFFIVIPTKTDIIEKGNYRTTTMNLVEENTVLCMIDEKSKSFSVINKEGKIITKKDIAEL